MKIIKKFQDGGSAPVATGAPAGPEAGGQDPIQMLAEMSMQALQAQDCQMAMQVCEGFVALVQQAMNAAPQGPIGEAPEGQPVFKKGGKMIGRKKCAKKACGGSMAKK